MPVSESFADFLAARLSTGLDLRVYHLSTRPVLCPALYSSAPGQAEEKTWCESHFLALAQDGSFSSDDEDNLAPLVLGIEVLVFTTEHLTTIFVSKADTTGLLLRQPKEPNGQSIAHVTISAFLEYLIRPRLNSPRLVLSLFARSQNQYLFPGSIENASKRILDDRQLIKWWCRVLDPIVRNRDLKERSEGENELDPKAYVVVPGCDPQETRSFFPASARLDSISRAIWANRYPAELLGKDVSLPPRCLIPRLPDDPKTRFLDDLDGAQVNNGGVWRDVKSLDQFWEMMSFRQECSAGRLVGFVWVVWPNVGLHTKEIASTPDVPVLNENAAVDAVESIGESSVQTKQLSPGRSDPAGLCNQMPMQSTDPVASSTSNEVTRSAMELHGQVVDPDAGGAGAGTGASVLEDFITWPLPTRGQLVLSADSYSLLLDNLLELDFAGKEVARQSTKDWIKKAMDMAAASNFGTTAAGSLDPSTVPAPEMNEAETINVLTAIRKKRKVDQIPATIVNSLSTNLVRKKPKSND